MKRIFKRAISLRYFNIVMIITTFVILGALFSSLFMLVIKSKESTNSTKECIELKKQVNDFEDAADYLTDQARSFVNYGELIYLNDYFIEVNVTKRRDKALEAIESKLGDTKAYTYLSKAMNDSKDAMKNDIHAMKLAAIAYDYDISTLPEDIQSYEIVVDEMELSTDEKILKARGILDSYFGYVLIQEAISEHIDDCIDFIDKMLIDQLDASAHSIGVIMIYQHTIIIVLMLFLFFYFLMIYLNIVSPLNRGIDLIKNDSSLTIEGVKEYRYFATEYNKMREINLENTKKIYYEAEHDKLTGVYNRAGYYSIYGKISLNKTAYILIDVDNFKKINDKYGHDIGDKVLVKIARILEGVFYTKCDIFRIGGDEFTVLVHDVDNNSVKAIRQMIHNVNYASSDKDSDTPPVTISAGVAFGSETDNCDSLFKKADLAVYNTKKNGRNGVTFFGDIK